MRQETRYIQGLPGAHHYTILSDLDLRELLGFGIVCTKLGTEESDYIVTEEEWARMCEEE